MPFPGLLGESMESSDFLHFESEKMKAQKMYVL